MSYLGLETEDECLLEVTKEPDIEDCLTDAAI
jgi:hypothetical protein